MRFRENAERARRQKRSAGHTPAEEKKLRAQERQKPDWQTDIRPQKGERKGFTAHEFGDKKRPSEKTGVFSPKTARAAFCGRDRYGSGSDGSGYLTGAQAAGANVDSFGRTVHDRFDLDNVGLPRSVGTSVGMGHLDAERNALAAHVAFCHTEHLL